MTTLPVELIGTIASFLKSGLLYCGQLNYSAYHQGQEDLASLLRVSKAVHKQCLPLLYHDCMIDNFGPLADVLRDRPDHPVRFARRIHLTPPPIPYYDVYAVIFESKGLAWKGPMFRSRVGEEEKIMAEGLVTERQRLAQLAEVIRCGQQDRIGFLPELKRALFSAGTEAQPPSVMVAFARPRIDTSAAFAPPLNRATRSGRRPRGSTLVDENVGHHANTTLTFSLNVERPSTLSRSLAWHTDPPWPADPTPPPPGLAQPIPMYIVLLEGTSRGGCVHVLYTIADEITM